MSKNYLFRLFFGIFFVLLGGGGSVLAQAREDLKAFDPSAVFFQGWLLVRDGDQLKKDSDYLKAYEKYESAKELFNTITTYHPEWRPDMVKNRLDSTNETMKKLKPKADKVRQEEEAKASPLVIEEAPVSKSSPLSQSNKQIEKLNTKLKGLKGSLDKVPNPRSPEATTLRRQIADAVSQRNKLATKGIKSTVDQLEERIQKLSRERDELAKNLSKGRTELNTVKAKVSVLDSDAKLARRRAQELDQLLSKERKVSNEVIETLRQELKKAKEQLSEKDKALTKSLAHAKRLEELLRESKEEIQDLKAERDTLLKEREQMTELLKLNEEDRTKSLIEQNLQLARELREARNYHKGLLSEGDATKDDLLVSKRDLAMAKARIQTLNQDYHAQSVRIKELQSRLSDAQSNIESNLKDPALPKKMREELSVLREIVQRQLRIQERRKRSKKLLISTIEKLGINNEDFQLHLKNSLGEEIKLTPEEQKLVNATQVDGEFILPTDRATPQERFAAENSLNRKTRTLSSLVKRMFTKGRLEGALDICDEILEQNPAHVGTMLNRGIILLKLETPEQAVRSFQDVIVLRGQNNISPYAHLMLGVCLYEMEDYEAARKELKISLHQDPNNANAHIYLGIVHALSKETSDAENHFQTASRLAPQAHEPLYNLAWIRAEQGRVQDARKLYRKALRNGSSPDFDLEAYWN